MLMQLWMPNSMTRPAAAKRQNGSSLRSASSRPRSTMKANMPASTMQKSRPNSSPVTAKMKSVWASGRMRLNVPSPGPLPSQPPDTKLSMRGVDLERVGGARPVAGIEEVQDAVAHVRHELVGQQARLTTPTPPSPTTQNQCSPAMKNSAAQTSEISMVWPKSGCRISGTMVIGSSSSARMLPGTSRRLAPSEKAQAARITKAGLTNSEGWMPKIQRGRPSPRGRTAARRRSAPCQHEQAAGRRGAMSRGDRNEVAQTAGAPGSGTSPGG